MTVEMIELASVLHEIDKVKTQLQKSLMAGHAHVSGDTAIAATAIASRIDKLWKETRG